MRRSTLLHGVNYISQPTYDFLAGQALRSFWGNPLGGEGETRRPLEVTFDDYCGPVLPPFWPRSTLLPRMRFWICVEINDR